MTPPRQPSPPARQYVRYLTLEATRQVAALLQHLADAVAERIAGRLEMWCDTDWTTTALRVHQPCSARYRWLERLDAWQEAIDAAFCREVGGYQKALAIADGIADRHWPPRNAPPKGLTIMDHHSLGSFCHACHHWIPPLELVVVPARRDVGWCDRNYHIACAPAPDDLEAWRPPQPVTTPPPPAES